MLSKKQKWQQGFDSAQQIKGGREGHFGAKLAEAYFYADGTNALILYENFPQYFQLAPIRLEPEQQPTQEPTQVDKAYFATQLTKYLQEQKDA
jgi:hypothetical protein